MSNVRNLLIGLCLAAASVGAMAQNTDEHSAHHPADAPGAAATVKTPSQPMDKGQMAAMDQQMRPCKPCTKRWLQPKRRKPVRR